MYAVEFKDVSKSFMLHHQRINSLSDALMHFFQRSVLREKIWALRDVSFTVNSGEIVGIIGPNGSGKSTILKLISRVLQPNEGEVVTRGRVVPLISSSAGFHHELTGRENVYLTGIIMGMTRREIDEKFDEILSFAGIKKFIDVPIKRYTPGMFLRLAFSITTHARPDILVVDEILAVGDAAFQEKCLDKVKALQKQKTTIIFVSHNLAMIKEICERAVFIINGKINNIGDAQEVIQYYEQQISVINSENIGTQKEEG